MRIMDGDKSFRHGNRKWEMGLGYCDSCVAGHWILIAVKSRYEKVSSACAGVWSWVWAEGENIFVLIVLSLLLFILFSLFIFISPFLSSCLLSLLPYFLQQLLESILSTFLIDRNFSLIGKASGLYGLLNIEKQTLLTQDCNYFYRSV